MSVEKLPGEVSLANNRAVVEINGVRDRLRVLLVSGEPHPGERTWRRLLKPFTRPSTSCTSPSCARRKRTT